MRKRIMLCLVFSVLFGAFFPVFSCFGEFPDSGLTGKWRPYSSRLYHDAGGGGPWNASFGRLLELTGDRKWKYGTSSGTFSIQIIMDEDWKRWNIDPYGPAMKIFLSGWNGTGGEGPIEESNGTVNFIWVLYHVVPPLVQNSGTVWIKFGH